MARRPKRRAVNASWSSAARGLLGAQPESVGLVGEEEAGRRVAHDLPFVVLDQQRHHRIELGLGERLPHAVAPAEREGEHAVHERPLGDEAPILLEPALWPELEGGLVLVAREDEAVGQVRECSLGHEMLADGEVVRGLAQRATCGHRVEAHALLDASGEQRDLRALGRRGGEQLRAQLCLRRGGVCEVVENPGDREGSRVMACDEEGQQLRPLLQVARVGSVGVHLCDERGGELLLARGGQRAVRLEHALREGLVAAGGCHARAAGGEGPPEPG
mmetsp:Transcript_16884/g.43142  ORF Transcript_16884/g.43142 Transcript_16884/m.43142 type:complete len:275 (+) Transcript_16884:190-1014(+)